MSRHGGYQLACYNRVLFARLSGQWSKATDMAYLDELSAYFAALDKDGAPWGFVVDFRPWELVVQDALEEGVDKIRRFSRQHQHYELWIMNNPLFAKILLRYSLFPDHLHHHTASSVEEALSWIRQYRQQVDDSEIKNYLKQLL